MADWRAGNHYDAVAVAAAGVLTPPDWELINEALGFMWFKAPARRGEIHEMCLRTGVMVNVDGS